MRSAAAVIGVLVALLGLVWIGQGLGYVKGSFMTGDPKWAVVGVVLVLVGAGLLAFAIRGRGRA